MISFCSDHLSWTLYPTSRSPKNEAGLCTAQTRRVSEEVLSNERGDKSKLVSVQVL